MHVHGSIMDKYQGDSYENCHNRFSLSSWCSLLATGCWWIYWGRNLNTYGYIQIAMIMTQTINHHMKVLKNVTYTKFVFSTRKIAPLFFRIVSLLICTTYKPVPEYQKKKKKTFVLTNKILVHQVLHLCVCQEHFATKMF